MSLGRHHDYLMYRLSLKTFAEEQCRNYSVGSSAKNPFAEITKSRQKFGVGEGRRIDTQ